MVRLAACVTEHCEGIWARDHLSRRNWQPLCAVSTQLLSFIPKILPARSQSVQSLKLAKLRCADGLLAPRLPGEQNSGKVPTIGAGDGTVGGNRLAFQRQTVAVTGALPTLNVHKVVQELPGRAIDH